MEFIGLTLYGPQKYFEDVRREDYKEPMVKTEVAPIIERVIANSTCPKEVRIFIESYKYMSIEKNCNIDLRATSGERIYSPPTGTKL